MILPNHSRKHRPVPQGDEPGQWFQWYVGYLSADNGFVPPNGRGWVEEYIRSRGNDAIHDVVG